MSCYQRLQVLGLLPLRYDREMKDLTFLSPALFEYIDINMNEFKSFIHVGLNEFKSFIRSYQTQPDLSGHESSLLQDQHLASLSYNKNMKLLQISTFTATTPFSIWQPISIKYAMGNWKQRHREGNQKE